MKRTVKRLIGAMIFAFVFGSLFALTCVGYGIGPAVFVWAIALVLTGLIGIGAALITS